MAETVGQHSVAAFTSPVNGTTPIDANSVRGNDNTVRSAYVDHDADPGIHVQSSTLASRPAAGTAGRKWVTVSSGRYQFWYDDGSRWHEVASDAVNVDCLADANLAKGDVIKITGFNNGQNLPTVNKVTSSTDVAFGIVENTVTSGNIVQIVNTGLIEDVDTNGYAVGTILYPNTSGGWTTTKPTSGNYQPAGFVLRGNTNNGVLYVEFSAPRIVERSNNEASTIVLRDASGNFAAGTITAGAVTSTGLVTFASLKGTGATTVTNILDEDNMASDSATALATQQSIKAYVDAKVATVDTLAEVLANGNTTGATNIIVTAGQKITTDTIDETTSGSGVTIDSVLLKDDVVNATDIEVDTISANNGTLAVTLASTGVATIAQQPILSSLTASQAVFTDASKGLVSNAITGTGNVVMSASPTLTGTVTAATLNATTLGGTLSTAAQTNITSVGTLTGLTVTNPITGSVTGSSGSTTGNAATATALQTARNINGVSFNGTADITVTAAAGTLTGTTLASGVTASSLTSLGTLSSLTVSGNTSLASSSGGVGIGVAAGSSKLNVAGTFTKNTGDENTWGIRVTDDTAMTTGVGGGLVFVGNYTSGGGKASFASIAGAKANSTTANGLGELRFYTTDVSSVLQQRAVIDSSGRVGIGTASPGVALDVVGLARADVGFVARLGSTNSGFFGPVASWLGSGSSTNLAISAYGATGAITFYGGGGSTEHMRLDASGNLGLGVTPTYRMQVYSDNSTAYSSSDFDSARNLLLQNANTTTNANIGIQFVVGGNSEAAITAIRTASGEASLAFGTRGGGARTTRMTLDASGNLVTSTGNITASKTSGDTRVIATATGVANTVLGFNNSGGTSAGMANNVGYVQTLQAYPLVFGTDSTERARITAGGYFKASPNGTYNNATGTYHEFVSTSDNTGTVVVKHTGTSGAQYGITITTVNDQNDATRYFWSGEGAGVERGTLRSNGGLANYSANNVNLASDERLKKDIAPLASTWDKLKAIEVVNFRYKDCNEGDPALYGVIAQQVQPIVPELVVVTREAVEAKDAELDEDGNEVKPAVEAAPEYYGIREQPMYWLAIKALQEAQARIEALEARLEALEA